MRVSDTQFNQLMLSSLQRNNVELQEVMAQISTGKRLNKLSDDPMAAVSQLNLSTQSSALTQYQSNIENARFALSAQETVLSGVVDGLQRARELVLWAGNGSLSDKDLNGIVTELNSINESLYASFNAQDEQGFYLFSGTKSTVPAVTFDGTSAYALTGNEQAREVVVGKGLTQAVNLTAKEMLVDDTSNILVSIATLSGSTGAGFDALIAPTLTSIDVAMDRVLAGMTTIGGRQNSLDLLNSNHQDTQLFVDTMKNELEALDYAEASLKLTAFSNAMQATQSSYLKIQQLSLFDRL